MKRVGRWWPILLLGALSSGCGYAPALPADAFVSRVEDAATVPTRVPHASSVTQTPLLAPSAPPVVTPTVTQPLVSIPTSTTAPLETPVAPTAITVVPTPTLPALDEAGRAEIFDQVWDLIAAHYLYADFGGVDWPAVRDEYRARALAADTPAIFYAEIKAMVAALGDDHSRFEDPQETARQQALASGTATYVGIGIERIVVADGLLITLVVPGSPADAAGLQRRDMIVAVDGAPVDADGSGISGPPGTAVRLTVRAPDGDEREVVVERQPVVFRYHPEARLVPGTQIGYLLIPSFWADDMDEQAVAALRALLARHDGRLTGLIIDMRGNGGGWRTVMQGLLSQFVVGDVGEFYSQNTAYPFTIEPGELYESLRDLPLVVLVDPETESYAEIFAAVLQSAGRAQVVGINTAGNTETIFAYDLADGSRVWIAQEGFRLPDGSNLEGRGVVPDRSIPVDWARFSEARDPHLIKAVELIRLQQAFEPAGADR